MSERQARYVGVLKLMRCFTRMINAHLQNWTIYKIEHVTYSAWVKRKCPCPLAWLLSHAVLSAPLCHNYS